MRGKSRGLCKELHLTDGQVSRSGAGTHRNALIMWSFTMITAPYMHYCSLNSRATPYKIHQKYMVMWRSSLHRDNFDVQTADGRRRPWRRLNSSPSSESMARETPNESLSCCKWVKIIHEYSFPLCCSLILYLTDIRFNSPESFIYRVSSNPSSISSNTN